MILFGGDRIWKTGCKILGHKWVMEFHSVCVCLCGVNGGCKSEKSKGKKGLMVVAAVGLLFGSLWEPL